MDLQTLLRKCKNDVALVIGNGINQYRPPGSAAAPSGSSWDAMLTKLARSRLGGVHSKVPGGVSPTEFYDLLDLARPKPAATGLQQEFCKLMRTWKDEPQHRRVVAWATAANVPILTTNFDRTLAVAGGCALYRTGRDKFTDYYPWDSYYGREQRVDPRDGFGIWHINGMEHYWRSIRLGLTHYMGSVEKARGWIHKGGAGRLFAGNDVNKWAGASTWLQLIFHKPLVIFGLNLEENEVFLRWLLIERARYFNKFPSRRLKAWYVYAAGDRTRPGKLLFLQALGIEPVMMSTYDEIYGAPAWA